MAESELIDNLDPVQEQVLGEYLASQLDGHLGRAELAFWKQIAHEQPAPPYRFRLNNRLGGWMLSTVGVALAASLGALWAGPSLLQVAPARPSAVSPSVSTPVFIERDVQSPKFNRDRMFSVTLDGNGRKRFIVQDQQGVIIYQGLIDTHAQRDAVPETFKPGLKSLLDD